MGVFDLIDWLEEPKSRRLIETYFKGRMPTKNDFPKECPYTFEQVMEYKSWVDQLSKIPQDLSKTEIRL